MMYFGLTFPGGLVCLVMREQFLRKVEEYKGRLEPFMDQLEVSGYWKRLQRSLVPNYVFGYKGVVWVYQVLLSGAILHKCDLRSA